MGQHQKILQIVGYSDSGKTTLMEQLITQATNEGLRVGTIKHHGHGGKPMVESSKDSILHEKAGACVTAVEGEGTLRISIQQDFWQLVDILNIYSLFKMDTILIEGYKNEQYSKVVLLRTSEDLSLLQKVSNIVCVLYWPTFTIDIPLDYPSFSIHEKAQYMDFLLKEMRRKS